MIKLSDFDSIHQVWPNTDEKKQKIIQFYHDLDLKSRGVFLIQTNWIESDIDSILALVFCGGNKKNIHLLKSTMLKRIGLDAKIQSLNKMITLRYPNLSDTFPKFKLQIDNLANNLETVKKFRNKLAHSTLSITDEFIEKNLKDRIPIRTYDDGQEKYLEIMKKEVEDKLVVCTNVQIALRVITKHILSVISDASKKEKSL